MIYTDITFPIPDSKTYELRLLRSGTEPYLYFRNGSKRVNGKLVHDRILIGKIATNIDSDQPHFNPNDNYFKLKNIPIPSSEVSRTAKRGRKPKQISNGFSQANHCVDKTKSIMSSQSNNESDTLHLEDGKGHILTTSLVAKEIGLTDILKGCMSSKLFNDTMSSAAFLSLGAPGGLSNIDDFTSLGAALGFHQMSTQDLSVLYKDLDSFCKDDFFRQWIALHGSNSVCYDITSISSYSSDIELVEMGYNRDHEPLQQVNLGLICAMQSKIPLFYAEYSGSINDFSNFPNVLSRARLLGLGATTEMTLVMDGGFANLKTLSLLELAEMPYILGMPLSKFPKIKAQTQSVFRNCYYSLQFFELHGDLIRYHEIPYDINGKQERLIMYRSDDSYSKQSKSLLCHITQLREELSTKKNPPVSNMRRYSQFFHINVEKDNSFTFTDNVEAQAAALSLCGCFAILSSRKDMSVKAILEEYRSKDCVEKSFGIVKNDILHERFRVKSSSTLRGKMFLVFIALVIRVRLEQLLRPVLIRNKIGIDSAIERLKSISFIRQGDKWFTHNALTKIQKEILYALGAKLDMLVSNWV